MSSTSSVAEMREPSCAMPIDETRDGPLVSPLPAAWSFGSRREMSHALTIPRSVPTARYASFASPAAHSTHGLPSDSISGIVVLTTPFVFATSTREPTHR